MSLQKDQLYKLSVLASVIFIMEKSNKIDYNDRIDLKIVTTVRTFVTNMFVKFYKQQFVVFRKNLFHYIWNKKLQSC